MSMSPRKTAEANIGSTLQNVTDLLIYEPVRGAEKEFKFIEAGLRRMYLMVQSVKGREGAMSSNNELDLKILLMEDMILLASRVDNVIEAFISRKRKWQKCWNKIKMSLPDLRKQTDMHKMMEELQSIKSSIFELTNRGMELGLTPFGEQKHFCPTFWSLDPRSPERLLSFYDIEEVEVASLEEDVRILSSRLIDGNENREVITITGERGTGKTTLAMKIFKNPDISRNFPCRAWVTLTPEFELKELLQMIAKELEMDFERAWTDEMLMNGINYFLISKKYLIVLDNVTTHKAWNLLQAVFPNTSAACRILVTTRDKEISHSAEPGSDSIYDMRALSFEESWNLFTSKVLVPEELENVGHEIVRKCLGLPLTIFTVGEYLSGKPTTLDEWLAVSEKIDQDLYCTLNLAADALPPKLKLCLTFLGSFHQDSYVSVRRLIGLWIGEVLVQQQRGIRKPRPECVAEKYLQILENQNMIEVGEKKPNGRIKSCRIHYLLRDWVKAKGASFVCSHTQGSKLRRLVDHLDLRDAGSSYIHGPKFTNNLTPSFCEHLCSILSFDSREGPGPGDEIGRFLRRGIAGKWFKKLRIIDLERVFRPKLPEQIGSLSELRYLGLRWTYIEKLPSSIRKLYNLHILDLKHTDIDTLPHYIWRMLSLRHVYLTDSSRIRFVAPPCRSSLTELQILLGLFLDEESNVKSGLNGFLNLRKLGMIYRLPLSKQDHLERWLLRLSHLEYLRLRSVDESAQPTNLYLKSLSELNNLSTLYLCGKLMNQQIVYNFPKKVTEITLSLSGLRDDPMPKLEKLPELRILRLLSGSYTGKKMVCSTGGFPLLEVLKLWNLEELKEWVVEEGALTIVKDIEIRSCKKLEEIPYGFQCLSECCELKIKDMPDEFKTRVIKDQGPDWHKIAHIPTIYIED